MTDYDHWINGERMTMIDEGIFNIWVENAIKTEVKQQIKKRGIDIKVTNSLHWQIILMTVLKQVILMFKYGNDKHTLRSQRSGVHSNRIYSEHFFVVYGYNYVIVDEAVTYFMTETIFRS